MKMGILWLLQGGAVPMMLMACGIFFTFYLRGLPMRRPDRMWQALHTPSSGTGESPFHALMLALAGTLGVGNIVGVANAIWVGGAGAVFWMWVSSLLAMVLKYAEILLAVKHRREKRRGGFFGGAIYYIRDHFDSKGMLRTGAVLSALFALLMILNALSMGCVIQVRAVSSAMEGVWGIPGWVSGGVLLLLTLPVMLRGSRRVGGLTEILVPVMTAGYLILTGAVLILRWDGVGEAFGMIFRDALSPASMGGGLLGFLTSRAVRTGTMRGLLSNEAGCGTAPTAHACANAASPWMQGVWGIVEVFVDTVLLCTATALVILVSYPQVEMLGEDGVMMVLRAYSSVLGEWSSWFLSGAILCFAYGTVLCWGHYGAESLGALTSKKRWRICYGAAFGGCVVLGALVAPSCVWAVADFALTGLTTVNLILLLLMRREIRVETDKCLMPIDKR